MGTNFSKVFHSQNVIKISSLVLSLLQDETDRQTDRQAWWSSRERIWNFFMNKTPKIYFETRLAVSPGIPKRNSYVNWRLCGAVLCPTLWSNHCLNFSLQYTCNAWRLIKYTTRRKHFFVYVSAYQNMGLKIVSRHLTEYVAFYIFIQQIYVQNILNMLHTLRFFSSKCRLFNNATFSGFCYINILYTGCSKIKKKIRRQRVKLTTPP